MRHCYIFLVSIVAATLLAQPVAHGQVTVTTVGTPIYQVVDKHIYAAPTDSFQSLFPNHFPTRIVHSPPYDQEYAQGLILSGFHEGTVFSVGEFTDPSAVHVGYTLIPNSSAPTGSTFDYVSGPIMPNAIFPISITGDVYLNGALFEQNAFATSLPGQTGFDGRSHFHVEQWENSAFAPPGLLSLVGNYEYRLTMRDANNNGYNMLAQFQVVPEPALLSNLIAAALVGGGMLRRRYAGRMPKSVVPSQS